MRKKFTRDMIQAAYDKGWTASQAARHYETHPSSVSNAAERFGISLPMSKYSPQNVSSRSKDFSVADGTKVPVFSASTGAIARALRKLETPK